MHSAWNPLLPLILLAAGGTVIFCAGAIWQRLPAGVFLAVSLLSAAGAGLVAVVSTATGSQPNLLLAMDGFSRFYTILFTALTALTLLFLYQYAKDRGFAGDELFGVILFAAAGMVLLASARHWLAFFLGLETMSIALYILIASRRGNVPAMEAAVKYFMMGAVASGFLLFGIAILYAATGTLSLSDSLNLAGRQGNSFLLLLGLGLILVGIGFKVSLVPFHLWTPDVYQGAPAPVTGFLATGSKVALFAVLVRLAGYGAGGAGALFAPALWTAAALTMIVGNITALAQTHLKRLLAYSSIAHIGYMTMALLAIRHEGATAVVFYSAAYACMDLGGFGAVGLLSLKDADRDAIEDYRGLGYLQPGRAALLTLFLFSLAGLPATAGFIGKFVLFRAAFAGHFVGLALIGILTAIVAVFFYLRVVVVLYMHNEAGAGDPAPGKTGTPAALACIIVAFLILGLGLFPAPILTTITGFIGSM